VLKKNPRNKIHPEAKIIDGDLHTYTGMQVDPAAWAILFPGGDQKRLQSLQEKANQPHEVVVKRKGNSK
jgi:hypothetical protein